MAATLRILLLVFTSFVAMECDDKSSFGKLLQRFLYNCVLKENVLNCFKKQAIKVTNRALVLSNFSLFDGMDFGGDEGRSVGLNLNDSKLEVLDSERLTNNFLSDASSKVFETDNLETRLPKLLNSEETLVEESRKSKNKKGSGVGNVVYWALAIKGAMLAIAFKGIAVISGMALMIGKMALFLSVILGLKNLINSDKETTTFEIVKKPIYSESHSYSNSYEDEGHHKDYDRNDNISRTIVRTYI